MLSKASVHVELKMNATQLQKSPQLIYEISPEMGEHIFQ